MTKRHSAMTERCKFSQKGHTMSKAMQNKNKKTYSKWKLEMKQAKRGQNERKQTEMDLKEMRNE